MTEHWHFKNKLWWWRRPLYFGMVQSTAPPMTDVSTISARNCNPARNRAEETLSARPVQKFLPPGSALMVGTSQYKSYLLQYLPHNSWFSFVSFININLPIFELPVCAIYSNHTLEWLWTHIHTHIHILKLNIYYKFLVCFHIHFLPRILYHLNSAGI